MTRFLGLFLVLVAGAAGLAGQTVRWEPPGGQLGYNQVGEITLAFEDCEPDGAPAIPAIDGLAFGRPSPQSLTSVVNFQVSHRFSLVYPVRASKRAPINIPAFKVQTDKGTIEVPAASYTVVDAVASRTGIPVDELVKARLEVPKTTVWAGEVFPVTYSVDAVARYLQSQASRPNWQPAPFVAEDWSQPELSAEAVRGEQHQIISQTNRVYAKEPGTATLKPVSQLLNLNLGTVGFSFFSQPRTEVVQVQTTPVDVTVRPLPPAPPGFTGIVGHFTLTSKVVPTAPAVGEPVTWTLELSGVGNWPDISGLPQREVSNDFQVVQPKSKRTMKADALFEGTLTEDIVLVPGRAGRYTLAPVKLLYFDPDSGTYKTLATDPATIEIRPAANAAAQTPGAPVQFSLNPAAPSAAPTAVPPTPPENLPRDALAEARKGITPFSARAVVGLCLLAAVACPLLAWVVFSGLRSRETDPQRPRREALRDLGKALAELRSAPGSRNELLREWQRLTAILWTIRHAAPGSPLVHAVVASHAKDAAAAWAALWADADRALHGHETDLPTDWIVRAQGAAQAVRLPEWSPFSLFRTRNLLPFVFALALVVPSGRLRADEAHDAYARADFPAAEAAWRKQIEETPADWTARHNLGLALAQQDHWGEATGYWTGAFLLAPRSETTRWDLALGLQNAGIAPSELVELSRGHGRFGVARLASPGEWQILLVIGSLLIATALIVLLFRGYRRIGSWARPAALATILAAVVLTSAATIALRAYGLLAHPDVALVWRASQLRSIPTEVETTQKTSPLSAGSIAIADRSFLTWTHLVFPGGQAGWVRSDDVVRIYR